EQRRGVPTGGDGRHQALRRLSLDVDERHPRPLGAEVLDDGGADPAAAAGHEDDTTPEARVRGEPAHGRSSLVARRTAGVTLPQPGSLVGGGATGYARSRRWSTSPCERVTPASRWRQGSARRSPATGSRRARPRSTGCARRPPRPWLGATPTPWLPFRSSRT